MCVGDKTMKLLDRKPTADHWLRRGNNEACGWCPNFIHFLGKGCAFYQKDAGLT